MSFYPRSGRRSGRRFMSSEWSQQQPSSIFNMNPLDVISNFMSPVLDIVSPLEDIRNLMSRGARMYGLGGQAPSVLPRIVPRIVQQRRRAQKTTPSVKRGQLLPQKYRIVIDCTDICDPKTLRTNIKRVQDNKHLIVTSDMKKGRQFKRSYTLPFECETKKMTKYITPQCQLVIEFNYMDVPLGLAIAPQHEICTTAEHGKCVHVKVPIADFVEPAKVKVHVKARDLFVHFEERIAPFGDFCSRVIYHTRVQLPQNVNLNAITAKSDKHKLTILAPIGAKKGAAAPVSQQIKDIAVKRKLRHRKARAVSVGAEQKQQVPVTGEKKKKEEKKKQVQPSVGEKQKKTPLETTAKPPISGQQEPSISKKQQKKQTPTEQLKSPILKPEEKREPSISEKKPEEKKPVSEQLPGVTSEEKKKKKKKSKKLTATTTPSAAPSAVPSAVPTAAPTPSATTEEKRKEPSPADVDVGLRKSEEKTPEQERSAVSTTEKGSDILKNILGGESSQQQQQGRESSATSATQASSSSERAPEERQQIGVSGSVNL